MNYLKSQEKKLALRAIKFAYFLYHGLFPSSLRTCRYEPTCSQYAIMAVEKFGILKGSHLALKRIISCNPLSSKPLIDPIP